MSLTDNQIVTMGELFADGTALDQVRGNQLVLWQEGRAQMGPRVDRAGQTYAPAILDPCLERVLHLPAGVEGPSHAEELIPDLREALGSYLGLDEHTLLVATAIVGTWVAECLPGPLLINPWGPVGTGTELLDLMGCLCRRALRLAEPSLHELASLRTTLTPTLILMRPSDRALGRLIAVAAQPDTYFLSGGQIQHVHCPMIACTRKPVTGPALTIPLLPARVHLRRITNSEVQSLADRFQPRLLGHRLTQHISVKDSQFDAPGFCPEVRLLARVLGAAVEGAPDLQASIIDALRGLDEQHKAEQSQTSAAVLESLLKLSHSRRPLAYIKDIAELANATLEIRGENVELSPRAVGQILREDLGLSGRRRAVGYELVLDQNVQQRVHRLASVYNVLQPVADCPRCLEVAPSRRTPHPVSGV